MHIDQLKKYKKILILGYGAEGRVTEQYLKMYHPTCTIGIADMSQGHSYLNKQEEYDLVVKTPGIPKSLVTKPHTTATNIFFANKGDHIIVGVTGSKGKSTTASLIYHILKESGKAVYLAGNIGIPALQLLVTPHDPKAIVVYELSSYQLDDIAFSPHISVIVSLFPDHMNYHGSKEQYYEAKHAIIAHAKPEDYFIYNPEYKELRTWAQHTVAHSIPFETDFIPSTIPLIGQHNISNVCAAITVARLFHIPDSQSDRSVCTFKPLPHRLQKVGEFKGIIFYDDAISTTPESTIAALHALPKVKTVLLGGEDRGYDFDELARTLKKYGVETIVLFPPSGQRIFAAIDKAYSVLPTIYQTDSMEKAVRFAYAHTSAGSVCLLSSASPSYSLWKNFEEKGNQFQLFVSQIGNE